MERMERLTTYGLAAVGLACGLTRYFILPGFEKAISNVTERLVDYDGLMEHLGKVASEHYTEEL